MELIVKGRFLLGVSYQDKLHYDFHAKILTMGAECTALDVIADLGLEKDSPKAADKMLVDLAYLAQQIEIEGIPQAALTPQFLLDNLSTDDYLLAMEQIALLRKKRQDVGETLNPTASG